MATTYCITTTPGSAGGLEFLKSRAAARDFCRKVRAAGRVPSTRHCPTGGWMVFF